MMVAIGCELVGTTSLKLSDGGRRPGWYLVVALGYAIAFLPFSRALKLMPLGIAYAMWAGIGIIGSTVIGAAVFHDKLSWTQIVGIATVLVGVVFLSLGPSAVPPQ